MLKGHSIAKSLLRSRFVYAEVDSKPISHEMWDTELKKYVSDKGRVDYRTWRTSKEYLNSYLDEISSHPPNAETWTIREQLAYWINAYNAFTVKLILDHYPIESIKDLGSIPLIDSPFDRKFFAIGGISFDLNTIEHEILRRQFDEPRIHFALVCAAISCPKLRNEAYQPSKINAQLDEQARYFINNPQKNRFSDEIWQISPIFNWFKQDFTRHTTLEEYIHPYIAGNYPKGVRIEFLEYNWQLNDLHGD